MSEALRARVQSLFVQATEILEDAHETAILGQSHRRSLKDWEAYATALEEAAQALAAVAAAILSINIDGHAAPSRALTKRTDSG